MTGRLARITAGARERSGAPAEATGDAAEVGDVGAGADMEEPTGSPWRRDRAMWIPIGALLLAAVVLVVLVVTGSGGDDATPSSTTPSTDANGFSIDSGDGSLTFDQDDDRASVAFSGPDQEGRFSFDLDGDGVVAEGEGGSFELDGGAPPAWPGDFPEPPGATVVRGSVLDAGDLVQLSTTYRTAEPASDVVAFYLDQLAQEAAIVEEPPPDSPAGATTISFEGRWTGFLSVSETASGTVVAVQLYSEPVPDE